MSGAAYLARWVSLERPAARRAARYRPTVPGQPTWSEGRWHAFFHGEPAAPLPAPVLPAQRVPQHDSLDDRPLVAPLAPGRHRRRPRATVSSRRPASAAHR